MPVFVYRAADRRGQTIDGVMEAPDARAVVERLQKDAYYPIRVAPHAARTAWPAFGRSSRVGPRRPPPDDPRRPRPGGAAADANIVIRERGLPALLVGRCAPDPRRGPRLARVDREARGGHEM